jgi:adenylate cyclase
MGIEIERKFLVEGDAWKREAQEGLLCRQGYLVADGVKTARVRIIGSRAFLTIKGKTSGISRSEFEYPIPVLDAESILELCDQWVIKTRYLIQHEGMTWELDVFSDANEGLVMAEIELTKEDQLFALPSWVGKEVSSDPRYYNACLSNHPFSTWGDS